MSQRGSTPGVGGAQEWLTEPCDSTSGLGEHLCWLEIAVNDMLRVRVRKCICHGDHVGQKPQAIVRALGLVDELFQRSAFDHFHRIERPTVGPTTELMHRHDARMFEAPGDQRLADEAGFGLVAAL